MSLGRLSKVRSIRINVGVHYGGVRFKHTPNVNRQIKELINEAIHTPGIKLQSTGAQNAPKPSPHTQIVSKPEIAKEHTAISKQGNINDSKPRFRKTFLVLGIIGTIYILDNAYSSSLTRAARAISILSYIGLKYKFSSDENIKKFHEQASDLLYYLMVTNKGLFIKFGQAVANQGTVFPIEFQRKFTKLYDEAPEETWSVVDSTLKHELGNDYESRVFEWIDHSPIASASIAQVHKAKLKSGREVAVKVQHAYIENQVGIDLFVYKTMVKFQELLFDLPMSYYARYISNQTLTETRFIHELGNTEKLRQYMAEDPSVKNLGVYIPETFLQYTTDKVLVMEWIDGISLIDKRRLIDHGYNLTTTMHQFITIFGKQIFKYGFIHSDPHPGNILVRRLNGKQQLVILDHGLYVELSEKFRQEYCQLWKYLFAFDLKGIRNIGDKWGIGSMDVFASAIQLKPIKVDASEVKPRSQKELMRSMLGDSSKFPLELLFLGRAMRIIQVCNKNLGSPVNRVNYLTDEALNSLISQLGVRETFNLVKLKVLLFVSTLIFWYFRFRQILAGDRYGDLHKGLEDSIDAYIKTTAKDMGMEWEAE